MAERGVVQMKLPENGEVFNPRLALARMTRTLRSTVAHFAPRTNRLKPEVLEALFRQEPWLRRGISKHAGDTVKMGFCLKTPDGEEHPMDEEFQTWWRDHRMNQKTRMGLISGHVYGDGLFEFEWDDGGGSTEEVPEGAELVEVHLIDPAYCRFQPFKGEDGATLFQLVQQVPSGEKVALHPNRYEHIALSRLPGYIGGLSTIEVAYHAALSKVKGDQGIGEILYHSGVPLRQGAIDGASNDEIDAVFEMLNDPDFQRAVAWDSRLKIHQHNPQAIDPAPFYEVIKKSIAAAIGIPVMMLEGAQAGQVSGSETNLEDYHGDLGEVQRNVLTPFVERVVVGVLGLDSADFEVEWLPFPTNERVEAESIERRITGWNLLVAGGLDPVAAGRIAGLDVREEDISKPAPGMLPPGAQAPPGAPPPEGEPSNSPQGQEEAEGAS